MSDFTKTLKNNNGTVVIEQDPTYRSAHESHIKQLCLRRLFQNTEIRKQILKSFLTNDSITNGKIKVYIPPLSLPVLKIASGHGHKKKVLVGNDQWRVGDWIEMPPSSAGGGSGQGNGKGQGDAEDFMHEFDLDEILDILDEDRILPNMQQKEAAVESVTFKRAGYAADGPPERMNVARSKSNSLMRRSLKKLTDEEKERYNEIKEEIVQIEATVPLTDELREKLEGLRQERKQLRKKGSSLPPLMEKDLSFNRISKEVHTISKTVMFFIMDVSGSMNTTMRQTAKVVMARQLRLLQRAYPHVDKEWIIHHTTAKIVDEKSFFTTTETGGTVVSSAFKELQKLIKEQYPPEKYNIYVSYASDGDIFPEETSILQGLLQQLIPSINYLTYFYVGTSGDDLKEVFEAGTAQYPDQFAYGAASSIQEAHKEFARIYPTKS